VSNILRSSPAKINLFLEIKGRRPDDYHEVVTWMHAVDVADSIIIGKSELDICTLRSEDTTIPFGKRNLCIKAYEALKQETGLRETVKITLKKSIPLGSGLGGGSSNAAAVLTGCNELFGLGLNDNRLMEIAAGVGSDVPFFIRGGSALATGRGTDITPLPDFPEPLWLVIAKPETAVSTGDAYKWIKGYSGEKAVDARELEKRILAGDRQFVLDLLHNSFEQSVFERYPAVREVKRQLLAEGCAAALMTGSGAAVFGVCDSEKQARHIEKSLKGWERISFVRACRTL